MYLCQDCQTQFAGPVYSREGHGEAHGVPAWEERGLCPACGSTDFEEAYACAGCGKLMDYHQLQAGFCPSCEYGIREAFCAEIEALANDRNAQEKRLLVALLEDDDRFIYELKEALL